MSSTLDNYLLVGTMLFVLGGLGFLTRRNLIVMVLSAEMMLHGVSVNLVAFSYEHGNFQGQVFTIFMLTVAACEAGLALALLLVLYQRKKTLDIDAWKDLGEAPAGPEPEEIEPDEPAEKGEESPRLTPAGKMPGEATSEQPAGIGTFDKSLDRRQETATRV